MRHRARDDDYYDDTVYTNTRDNQRSTAIVKRRSDSPDYDEEVRRDFSPGGGGYYRETITRKSGIRPAGARARSYDDDRYYDDDRSYASSRKDSHYAGAGRRRKDRDDRRNTRRSRYDSDESSSRSRTPPPKRERRKSMPEEALEALGLGGLAATLLGKKKNRSRSRSSSRSRRSSRGRGPVDKSEHRKEQMQQALQSAVLAGAATAFRARNEPGGWNGEKGKRVLTAAFTAGGVNGFVNRDGDPEKNQLRDTIGSAVAGILTDRVVNGSRSQSRARGRDADGRPRSRSGSRSRVKDLAGAGLIAAAAKKAADSFRGRSSSRGRRGSRSSSDNSRGPPKRSRSRSVIAKGLSKIGLDSRADKIDPYGARERSRSRGPRSRSRGRYDDEYDDRRSNSLYDPHPPAAYGGGSMYDNREVGTNPPHTDRRRSLSQPRPRSVAPSNPGSSRALDSHTGAMVQRPHSVGPGGNALALKPPPPGYMFTTAPQHHGDPETDSDTDLGSSSDDEKDKMKSRKRAMISGGLATVATIHAGNSVYQSMEKRQRRKKALKDGTIDQEQAKKNKNKDRMQDVASIGLAALGIKGAYSEWKEMKEEQDEFKKKREANLRHARKREARRQKSLMLEEGVAWSDIAHKPGFQPDPGHGPQGVGGPGPGDEAPTWQDPFYRQDHNGRQQAYHGAEGPYMSGGQGQGHGQQGGPYMNGNNHSTQYFDGNPYGWMGQPPQSHQPQHQFPRYDQDGYQYGGGPGGPGHYTPSPGAQGGGYQGASTLR